MRIRYAILALVISTALWGMARGTSSSDRGFDIPIGFHEVPEDLVITSQSTQAVNIRVLGTRAALREIEPSKLEYAVNVEGVRPGKAVYEVDVSQLEFEMPRGARILSRSPATIELELERRGRKSVRVEADVVGEPAEGFLVTQVDVVPPRVWLAGARKDVLRLAEVVTETVEVAGLTESVEREVALQLGGGHVWLDQDQPVVVRIQVDAVEGPGPGEEPGESEG